MIQTIKDLEKEYNNEFLRTVLEPLNYPFFNVISLTYLDKILRFEKGMLKVVTEDREELKEILEYTIYQNKYKYTKLAESLLFDYNPIENYNMAETESFENNGSGTQSSNASYANGQQKEIVVNGERKTTDNIGERTETMLNGAKTESLKHGAVSETNVFGASMETDTTDYGTQTENNVESLGAKNVDISSTVGGGTDTKTTESLPQTVTTEEIVGGKTDTKTDTLGAKKSVVSSAVNSFDTENYNNLEQNTTNEDGVTNSTQNVFGGSTNNSTQTIGNTSSSESTVTADRNNTENRTESAVENSSTLTKNGYTDIAKKSVSEKTDTKNIAEYTDTNTTAESTDTKTTSSAVDSSTLSSTTDTITKDSFTNSETGSITKSDTESGERTLNRSGNIGVTTTQQMIQQERDIAKFSLEQIIIADIVENLCIRLWDLD